MPFELWRCDQIGAITAWATYGLQKPHEKSEEVHVVSVLTFCAVPVKRAIS